MSIGQVAPGEDAAHAGQAKLHVAARASFGRMRQTPVRPNEYL